MATITTDAPPPDVFMYDSVLLMGEHIPGGIIAPIDIETGDTVSICGICGVVRVDRNGEPVYIGQHNCEM